MKGKDPRMRLADPMTIRIRSELHRSPSGSLCAGALHGLTPLQTACGREQGWRSARANLDSSRPSVLACSLRTAFFFQFCYFPHRGRNCAVQPGMCSTFLQKINQAGKRPSGNTSALP